LLNKPSYGSLQGIRKSGLNSSKRDMKVLNGAKLVAPKTITNEVKISKLKEDPEEH
jgi:hypothetical protein